MVARPGTQTVAVATQTIVSSTATVNSNTPPIRTQIKPKAPKLLASAVLPHIAPQMATTQTQTNQSPPQVAPHSMQQPTPQLVTHQKSDAANQTQTNQVNERKPLATYSRSVSASTETKQQPQLMPLPKSQAMVAPSTKIVQATVAPCVDMSVSTSTSTLTALSSTTPVLPTSTVQVNTSVPTVDVVSSTISSVSHVPPVSQMDSVEPVCELNKSLSVPPEPLNESVASQQTESTETATETDHLKPQQPLMKPSLGPIKEKQPQKAIVKPQVLTHVIDGFLIQEGPESFPAQIEENEVAAFPAEENNASVADDESSTFSNKTEEDNSELQEDSSHTTPVSLEREESMEIQKTESLPPSQKLPSKWTVQDVFELIRDTPGCSDYADTFKSQEINGQALLLLKEDHLMTAMCMKLGPALKLISQINCIKEELGHS